MKLIILYWTLMILGYFTGSKLRKQKKKFIFIDNVLLVLVSLLVFIMGLRMGSNNQVISNIGSIGLEALLFTIIVVIGGVCAITITRKILKIDKWGRLTNSEFLAGKMAVEETQKLEESEKSGPDFLTWSILVFVSIGVLLGYLFVNKFFDNMDVFDKLSSNLMVIGLATMLGVIGFNMGLEGTVIKYFSTVGIKVLAFPLAVFIGTILSSLFCALILPLSIKESLAIGLGFGWYTFAPIAIAKEGYVIASAVSFMHNVFRELGGIVLIPILAKKIGFIEVTGLPGCASGDMCMPIIERATRQDIIVYGFTIGILESLSVPLLVPLIIGL